VNGRRNWATATTNRPTGDVDPASDLAQREIFSPVLSILRFGTDDEAVELANNTHYGLAAYVHTRDLRRAHVLAAALDAGGVAVNGFPIVPPARSFSMLVIADLLGVPAEDHDSFRDNLAASRSASAEAQTVAHNPLQFLEEKFTAYVEDRRRNPRNDVLTSLAQAKYPDESRPEVIEVVHLATFLFAAGQETTTQLLAFALRELAERPDLQHRLREDSSIIPDFLEETLRVESPIKSHFRLASNTTTVGGVPTPAGTTVMLLPGAFNRDPARFDEPDELRVDRPNVREHVAFGRGVHTCPGAPLAGSKAVSRSSVCCVAWPTSGSANTTTGPPMPAATPTTQPSLYADSKTCISNSRLHDGNFPGRKLRDPQLRPRGCCHENRAGVRKLAEAVHTVVAPDTT
jgi:hypothetical protein